MKDLRTVALLAGIAAACHGGPEVVAPGTTPPRPVGKCSASSVVTSSSCPQRNLPPSNASSARGCKSDAECNQGIQGRCVDTGYREPGAGLPVRPSNLLAGPPPLPTPTTCSYDQCTSNAECGADARCACGEGSSRSTCVALDRCLADSDCAPDGLCICGDGGRPNTCVAGNCRVDGDCAGLACVSGPSGSYCATPGDTCRATKDCASTAEFRVCDYNLASKAWACRVVPPRPPG